MNVRVLVCGGGTGGHVYPALAVLNEFKQLGGTADQILWVGTHGQMEEKLVPRAGLRLETIAAGPIAGVAWKDKLINMAKMSWSIGSANRLMSRFQPDVIFLTGGYVNAPVAVAAAMRRIPAMIYLPDVEPGSAIKALIRFVQKVGCTTPGSAAFLPAEKMVVTGYPVRAELRQANMLSLAEALAQFNLTPGRKSLFVFGGSRGARSINHALLAILPQLLDEIQVIHISGELDWPEVEAFAAELPVGQRPFYRPFPYLHERMGAAFRSADLVVARAGASMLGESPAFGVPTILVPYPYVWRYQKVNADFLTEQGAGIRLDDEAMPEKLLPTIRELLQDETRLNDMAAAANALDKPDAAKDLAQLLIALGKGEKA